MKIKLVESAGQEEGNLSGTEVLLKKLKMTS
jgi:hypothetical protein